MERSRKRSRGEFTAEEMEAAEYLLRLSDCFFVQWAAKRRRSAIARNDISDTHQSKLDNRNPMIIGLPPPSKLVACFNQSQEAKLLSSPQPTTSADRVSSHGTISLVSLDDSFNHFVGTLGLRTMYGEPLQAGVSVHPPDHEL